jgi:hypothetical protein
MSGNPDLDRIRASALQLVESKERQYKTAFYAAVAVEGLFLALFVLLADFTDRIQLLIFLGAGLVYWTLALGLIALGAYVGLCTQRVLKAIDLLDPKAG